MAFGLAVRDVRTEGLAASRGATDFGEYFAYFSFFLVVSAITLASLFFKLGVEQRVREVGLLRAVGFAPAHVRRLFVGEAWRSRSLGSLIGVAGAIVYGALMMAGLRTWWVDAVGTTSLRLHVSPVSLLPASPAASSRRSPASGGRSGRSRGSPSGASSPARLATIDGARGIRGSRRRAGAWRLLALSGARDAHAERRALTGWMAAPAPSSARAPPCSAPACSRWRCSFDGRRADRSPGHGWWPLVRLGLRNATYRPGRTVLSIAVVASAAFILISVDAFRRDGAVATGDPHSGTGGYALLVDTVLPLVNDPGSADGREQLG